MPVSVVMPALEIAQETGKLIAWRKQEGDAVVKGDLLMEIETDKAVVEVEAGASGTLAGVSAQPGDVVKVGQVIAWILGPGEQPPAATPPGATSAAAGVQAVTLPTTGQAATPGGRAADRSASGPLLSPRARRLAAERGVDVRTLRASGADGVVHAGDVQAVAASATSPITAASSSDVGSGFSRISTPGDPDTVWRLMAERVTTSWTSVPHFFVTRGVDATALVAARTKGAGITYTDLLVALLARTLKKHPRLNASWADGTVRYHEEINVGIATAVEQAVVAPVVHGADRLTVEAISARRIEIVERARTGRLQPSDLAGGTVTISNLGMYGVDAFMAIVNAPQSAILAVGRVADQVVARDGKPTVCAIVTLTLSCDHRVVDGARAAEFLAALADAIARPEDILAS